MNRNEDKKRKPLLYGSPEWIEAKMLGWEYGNPSAISPEEAARAAEIYRLVTSGGVQSESYLDRVRDLERRVAALEKKER